MSSFSSTFFRISYRLKNASLILVPYIVRQKFFLAAFLVPLLVRSIPEIIAGQYPIGYDTIAAYVPSMLDWGSGNATGLTPLIGGWLMYAIFGMTYLTTHADPILITKIASPIIYGILGLSLFFFGRNALNWSNNKSFALVILSSTYFVLMRISWDLVRNTLGISLLLIAITLGRNISSPRRAIAYALVALLVMTTHLLAGAIFVGIVAIEMVRPSADRLRKGLCALPAIAYFSISLVAISFQGVGLVAENGASLESLSAYLFPFYIFLPLLPLAILGLRKLSFGPMRQWLLLCCLGLLLARTPIAISQQLVVADRWTFMMAVPLAVYAVQAPQAKWFVAKARLSRSLLSAWALLVIVLGSAYLVLPAQSAFPYYRYVSPNSMLQSSVSLQDSRDLAASIAWLSANIHGGAVIIAHHSMYGWLREYFHGSNVITGFPPNVSLNDAFQRIMTKNSQLLIYTVWWTSGYEWYGVTVPTQFVAVHTEGHMSVYYFQP